MTAEVDKLDDRRSARAKGGGAHSRVLYLAGADRPEDVRRQGTVHSARDRRATCRAAGEIPQSRPPPRRADVIALGAGIGSGVGGPTDRKPIVHNHFDITINGTNLTAEEVIIASGARSEARCAAPSAMGRCRRMARKPIDDFLTTNAARATLYGFTLEVLVANLLMGLDDEGTEKFLADFTRLLRTSHRVPGSDGPTDEEIRIAREASQLGERFADKVRVRARDLRRLAAST